MIIIKLKLDNKFKKARVLRALQIINKIKLHNNNNKKKITKIMIKMKVNLIIIHFNRSNRI